MGLKQRFTMAAKMLHGCFFQSQHICVIVLPCIKIDTWYYYLPSLWRVLHVCFTQGAAAVELGETSLYNIQHVINNCLINLLGLGLVLSGWVNGGSFETCKVCSFTAKESIRVSDLFSVESLSPVGNRKLLNLFVKGSRKRFHKAYPLNHRDHNALA